MKPVRLFRAAAVVLVLFAGLHTAGFLNFRPPTQEGLAVWDGMQRVHFSVKGSSFSYGAFYVGFGLFATVFLLFSAYLAWYLGDVARQAPGVARRLGWALCAAQTASLVLSGIYFSAAPAVFSGVVAAMLGSAAALAH